MSYQDIFSQFSDITQARINLGNSGSGLPTKPLLDFRLDHASAKDAVYADLDIQQIQSELNGIGLDSVVVRSCSPTREIYLKRPDLGRSLDEDSRAILQNDSREIDLIFIIADGLSANAVQVNAVPFLASLLPRLENLTIDKVIVAKQARVAISDEIGEIRKAAISIILIGERPGLSSSDSMGVYMTYHPNVGNTDEKRNCISNVRQQGLSVEMAAFKLNALLRESYRLKLSGVGLKDVADELLGEKKPDAK